MRESEKIQNAADEMDLVAESMLNRGKTEDGIIVKSISASIQSMALLSKQIEELKNGS